MDMLFGNRRKGYAALTMAATAAAVSGLVAYGSAKLMGLQYSSVGSTTQKMVAKNYALNRAEIIKASPYDNLRPFNKVHDNGFLEDVEVNEDFSDGKSVKTAKVNIYKDSSKKELVSSMIVKRTNPTAGLAEKYKPEGADDTAYNSSVVNDHFATVDDLKHDDRTVGSSTHPVYVKDGNIEEINMANAKSSNSRKLLVVNEDGSLGSLKALDFFSGAGLATVSVGTQGWVSPYFTREKGADISLTPYYGQMIIVTNQSQPTGSGGPGPRANLGIKHEHAHYRLGVHDPVSKKYSSRYWVRSDYGAGTYNLGQYVNRLQLDSFHSYYYTENVYGPYFAIFGDAYDEGGYHVDQAWILVGATVDGSWPGSSWRYNRYLCRQW